MPSTAARSFELVLIACDTGEPVYHSLVDDVEMLQTHNNACLRSEADRILEVLKVWRPRIHQPRDHTLDSTNDPGSASFDGGFDGPVDLMG